MCVHLCERPPSDHASPSSDSHRHRALCLSVIRAPMRLLLASFVASFAPGSCMKVDSCAATVITSVTPKRYDNLIPTVIESWLSLGVCSHIVILFTNETEREAQTTQNLVSVFKTSYEMVPMVNAKYQRSLPGLSRYLAACENRFEKTTLLISDIDLLPLPPMRAYLDSLLRSTSSDTILVDFVYPATTKFFDGSYKFTNNSILEKHYTRTPRFRTCYLVGTGRSFRRVFNIARHVHSVHDIVDDMYDETHITIAYSPVRLKDHTPKTFHTVHHHIEKGPDNSYDEILFGKLAVSQGNCRWNEASMDYRTSKCLRFKQRSHDLHPMIGENRVPFRCDDNSRALDVHLSSRRNKEEIHNCITDLRNQREHRLSKKPSPKHQ